MNKVKEIITLTTAAKNRVKEIITKGKKNYIGIRISIDNTGCSGHSYKIDYFDNGMESGFVFSNPNEKGRCGCGESFSV